MLLNVYIPPGSCLRFLHVIPVSTPSSPPHATPGSSGFDECCVAWADFDRSSDFNPCAGNAKLVTPKESVIIIAKGVE